MQRVTGLGGVFVKTADKDRLRRWYRDRLGIAVMDHGANFEWRERDAPEVTGYSVWGLFGTDSPYFDPSRQPFMINFRVASLDPLLAELHAAGETVDERIEDGAYGRFGWVMDPDGTRIELWEPPPQRQATSGEIEALVRNFLAAVDGGDAPALAGLLAEDVSAFFPYGDPPGLVSGQAAVLGRFERRFEAWRKAGRALPFVGFEPREFIARELTPGYALATFALSVEGTTGRRSLVARRGPEGWRMVHLHASNLD